MRNKVILLTEIYTKCGVLGSPTASTFDSLSYLLFSNRMYICAFYDSTKVLHLHIGWIEPVEAEASTALSLKANRALNILISGACFIIL